MVHLELVRVVLLAVQVQIIIIEQSFIITIIFMDVEPIINGIDLIFLVQLVILAQHVSQQAI